MKKYLLILIFVIAVNFIYAQKSNCGTITDIDGNVYNTVAIGTQCWMQENLKTTKYNNGISIPNVTDNSLWGNLSTPSYCYYNDSVKYKSIYGALYNWFAVNTGKLCPLDWHVPTDVEWTKLTDYLGGENVASDKMKEEGTAHWIDNNISATNSSGFSALPAGFRGNSNEKFEAKGHFAYIWSSTQSNSLYAWQRRLAWNENRLWRSNPDKYYGFSVRCLADAGVKINENKGINNNIKIYPNPANDQITISYQLTKNSSVGISIYDITGREVKEIINDNQTNGEHNINISTQHLEDGIYILRLNTKDYSVNRKISVKH